MQQFLNILLITFLIVPEPIFSLFGLVLLHGISTIIGYLMPNVFLYTKLIYKIWLCWVLWHINHYRLFNTKCFLYI